MSIRTELVVYKFYHPHLNIGWYTCVRIVLQSFVFGLELFSLCPRVIIH